MPSKKKTKKKPPVARILWLSLLALFVIAITFFLAKSFLQEQKDQQLLSTQKVRLDAAEKDINKVAAEILTTVDRAELADEVFTKTCDESSTKYGRGTITCGPFFAIVLYTAKEAEGSAVYESKLQSVLNESTIFNKKPAFFRDLGANILDTRVLEITGRYNGVDGMKCYFSVETYTTDQYEHEYEKSSMGKNAVVMRGSCSEVTKEPVYQLRG